MTPQFSVTIVRDAESLHTIEPQWDRLVEANPFLQPLWLSSWWDAARPSGGLFVMAVRDSAGALRGMLPLYRQSDVYSGVTLRSMGDTAACTDYFSLVASQEDVPLVASALANFLADHADDYEYCWDRLVLDGVAGNDLGIRQLVAELEQRGASAHASARMNFWRLSTAGPFEQWLTGFSRSSRQDLRRRHKVLETSSHIQRRAPSSPAEVERDTDVVIDLHQRRWLACGQPGSFVTPQSREFIHRANQTAFELGQLHLRVLTWDDQPASGEIGYVGRDQILYLYCVGREPALDAKSVGTLSTLATQVEAFEGSLQAIDYLRGDETYKSRSHAAPTACLSIRIAAPTWHSRLRHAVWLASFEMSQLMRKGVGRNPVRTQSLSG